MSNFVFVIDTNHKPLNPCKPGVARSLLDNGKAAVFRRYPFTIILKKAVDMEPDPLVLKIDPGSKTTGFAILNNHQVIFAAELTHRGQVIKASLESRRASRRNRRARHTRYRPARFLNRTRKAGWLAPSLAHRVHTTLTWVNRFRKYANITEIRQELVRFDLQLIDNPEIVGVEYQQGVLAGYEVREYLLEKWKRECSYCGKKNVPLQIEHIHPKSKGGSNKVSNLCLACESCNTKKGTMDVKDFLKKDPERLKKILAQAKQPLKDAAAVNSTRWALFRALKETGLEISTGSGGLTKFNRTRLELPKTHWLDAACVGETESLEVLTTRPLLIKAMGHGSRQMCRTDKFGFPKCHITRTKVVHGFQTGDIVKAIVTTGKKIGEYLGRVSVRARGCFTISGIVNDISHKFCSTVHKKDGYLYQI
jgi:5-methylcytosine-specific restriction endonuclease McrA